LVFPLAAHINNKTLIFFIGSFNATAAFAGTNSSRQKLRAEIYNLENMESPLGGRQIIFPQQILIAGRYSTVTVDYNARKRYRFDSFGFPAVISYFL
jgi:hypothetical protein